MKKLFSQYELRAYLADREHKINAMIEGFTNDEIMGNDLAILCDAVCNKYRVEPLVLMEENTNLRKVKNGKVRKWFDAARYWTEGGRGEFREVDGVTLTFAYPFTGTESLFDCQASTFSLSGYPEVEICNGHMLFELAYTIDESRQDGWKDRVINQINEARRRVQQGIDWINNDLVTYNHGFETRIMNLLKDKKGKVETFYAVAKMFDVSPNITPFGARVISVPKRAVVIAHSYLPEGERHCISDQTYNDILSIVKHTASTWERTPLSYRGMGEEDLRNVLLSALNGLYVGSANGEAFRKNGKTDICIEEKNRAAFVAECKMWTGEKQVAEALVQLDGYTTWRDCKTALIYFVRRKDFVAVLDKMKVLLPRMSVIRNVKVFDKNEFQCSMISASNPGRLTDVRVLLFNLYTEGVSGKETGNG